MSFRSRIRWISYGAALLLCLAVALFSCHVGAGGYVTRLNADSTRAMGEALAAVERLDTSLKKSAFAATPMMESTVCAEIYSDAQIAENALSVLPVQTNTLEEMARHIAVVGDYASMLSRASASGYRFSEDNLAQLASFSETTTMLHEELAAMQQAMMDGALEMEHFGILTDSLDNLERAAEQTAESLGSEMAALADRFPKVPALVYDGQYTDRSGSEAKMIAGKPEVSEDEACSRAAAWLSCDVGDLERLGRSEGTIPCWNFLLDDAEQTITAAVTVQGGEVLRITSSEGCDEAQISHEDAEKAAEDYLAEHGISDLELCGYETGNGQVALQYAAVQNGILCYPDMIGISVSLDTGDVLNYDARDYLQNHVQRDLSLLSGDTSLTDKAIPKSVTVNSMRPVVLDAIGLSERLCYAYECTDANGQSCRIIVNAETGEQEQILLREPQEDSNIWS